MAVSTASPLTKHFSISNIDTAVVEPQSFKRAKTDTAAASDGAGAAKKSAKKSAKQQEGQKKGGKKAKPQKPGKDKKEKGGGHGEGTEHTAQTTALAAADPDAVNMYAEKKKARKAAKKKAKEDAEAAAKAEALANLPPLSGYQPKKVSDWK